MHTRRSALALLVGAFALLAVAPRAGADSAEVLQKRIAQRRPAIQKLKDQGKVGETYEGLVEAVKDEYLKETVKLGDKKMTVGQLLGEENADRKAVYKLIAKKLGVDPDVVARRKAERTFKTAEPGEYLKGKDGKWFRKKKD
ncbi:MAG: YdbL family protein [Candidatus Brocadiia bacterium]